MGEVGGMLGFVCWVWVGFSEIRFGKRGGAECWCEVVGYELLKAFWMPMGW